MIPSIGTVQAQPQWWRDFVQTVNQLIVSSIEFFYQLSAHGIIFLMLLIWLIIMGVWVRQFPKVIARFYWLFVVLYLVIGLWFLL